MIDIVVTDEFKKRYLQLPIAIRKKAQRKEAIFHDNPFHPSLKTEKLKPKEREVWSFRIDREYRIIFRFIDTSKTSKVLFLTCGHHHFVYRYRF